MSRSALAVRRVVVTVVGGVVLLAGLLMLVLPGPGLLGTAAGLAILSTEYHWARRYVVRVRRRAHQVSTLAGASARNVVMSVLGGLGLAGLGVLVLVFPDLLPVGAVAAAVGLIASGALVVLGTVLGYRERQVALHEAQHQSADPTPD